MRRLALTAVAAALLAVPAGAAGAPTAQQELFRATLLDDPQTTTRVNALLRDGGGFVARDTRFADLTGDGRADAVARVVTGGAAGAVAVYVLSTHGLEGDAPLRAIYRSQRLYRAGVRADAGGPLRIRTPVFRRGSGLCCPTRIRQRTYTWSPSASRFVRRDTTEFEAP